MEILEVIVQILGIILSVLGTFLGGWFVIAAIFGLFRKKVEPFTKYPYDKKFAVLVAAHNEESVIENSLKALLNVDYPSELIDIYLIADNCSDSTAAIGKSLGVNVCERFNDEKKGKGYALTWMLDKLWATNIEYDAVCLLDADNIVDVNYFKEMNKSLHQGHEVVQGYLGCKNPEDSWVSAAYSISYWITNRLYQLARGQLNGSSSVGGTGFIVKSELLRSIGWDSHCLTEDLEFQLKIVSMGKKVVWNHDAIFYDEKPTKLIPSIKQRIRWMQGHADCTERFFVPMLKKAFKEKSIIALDTSIYLIQPFINCILMCLSILIVLLSIPIAIANPEVIWGFLGTIGATYITMVFFAILLAVEHHLTPKVALYLIIFPIFTFSWIPAIIMGAIKRKERVWEHTEHQSNLSLDKMV